MSAHEFEKALDKYCEESLKRQELLRRQFWCGVFDGAIVVLISISAVYLVYRIVTAL